MRAAVWFENDEDKRKQEKAARDRAKIRLPTLHFMGDERSTGLEILKQAEELPDDDMDEDTTGTISSG